MNQEGKFIRKGMDIIFITIVVLDVQFETKLKLQVKRVTEKITSAQN